MTIGRKMDDAWKRAISEGKKNGPRTVIGAAVGGLGTGVAIKTVKNKMYSLLNPIIHRTQVSTVRRMAASKIHRSELLKDVAGAPKSKLVNAVKAPVTPSRLRRVKATSVKAILATTKGKKAATADKVLQVLRGRSTVIKVAGAALGASAAVVTNREK